MGSLVVSHSFQSIETCNRSGVIYLQLLKNLAFSNTSGIVGFLQLLKRLRHLQGLPVAAGFFQHLSIVGFLQLDRLSAQASRLTSTGAIVKTLPL